MIKNSKSKNKPFFYSYVHYKYHSKGLPTDKCLSSKNLCRFLGLSSLGLAKNELIDLVLDLLEPGSSISSKVQVAAFSCSISSAVDQLNLTSIGYPNTWSICSRINFFVTGSEIKNNCYVGDLCPAGCLTALSGK